MSHIEKIILGTVQLGLAYGVNNSSGQPTLEQSFEILNLAQDSGISSLDTAEAYGNSFEVISKYLGQSKSQFSVLSKFHFEKLETPFLDFLKNRAQSLPNNCLQGISLHDENEIALALKNKGQIKEAIEKNLIKKFGISIYSLTALEEAVESGLFSFLQIPFNILDCNKEKVDLLKKAKEKGIEIHVRSVFLQGLFFKSPDLLTGNLVVFKEVLQKLQAQYTIDEIQSLCLQFPLQQRYIDKVVIGVETSEQLKENINVLNNKVSFYEDFLENLREKIPNEMLNPSQWKA